MHVRRIRQRKVLIIKASAARRREGEVEAVSGIRHIQQNHYI